MRNEPRFIKQASGSISVTTKFGGSPIVPVESYGLLRPAMAIAVNFLICESPLVQLTMGNFNMGQFDKLKADMERLAADLSSDEFKLKLWWNHTQTVWTVRAEPKKTT